ncbi:MAG: polysaccharide biosynthesis/export family protein [Candidatus Omnitrophota bacterium]
MVKVGKQSITRIPVILIFLLLFFCQGCARITAPHGKLSYATYSPEGTIGAEGQYIIGVRDELEVLVWRCPEMDSKVTVRPADGKISFPLIGDITADGRTPKELAQAISEKLAYYVKEPRVAVGVVKFGEKKVFVLGQVFGQGAYRLAREDRIIDVISQAGGFTEAALPAAVYIVRGGYNNPKIVKVNLSRLIEAGDTSQNVYMEEGDIVYVPRQEIEQLNYVLRKIFPSLYFAERLADLKQSIVNGDYDWKDVFRKRGFWE